MLEKYGDQIYKPGDGMPDLTNLTTKEMEERDAEVRRLFAQAREKDNVTNGSTFGDVD